MKPSETSAIYSEACRSRRISPQEDEGRLWHKVLSSYDVKDVRAALDAWWADTTPGKDGEPRGKWVPAPTELKPLVERVIQRRAEAAAVKRYFVRFICPACRFTSVSFLAVCESAKRLCPSTMAPDGKQLPAGQRCRKALDVAVDERPKS